MKRRVFECDPVILYLVFCSSVFFSAGNVHQGIENPTANHNHQVEIEPAFKISRSLQSYIQGILLAQFEARKEFFIELNKVIMKCGILGNWRRIAYFDTTQGDSCPTGLRTVTNTTTSQIACGRNFSNAGCASVHIPVQFNYSQVCGIVKGYQEGSPDAFGAFLVGLTTTIDMYVDGVSITQGSPRKHLWTYANGVSEENEWEHGRCSCARTNPTHTTHVPDFVGGNYYCESGFSTYYQIGVVAWDDPLWDGQSCVNPNNKCCERYGWFHQDVPLTSDNIELRICGDEGVVNEDTLIEYYEFWVM